MPTELIAGDKTLHFNREAISLKVHEPAHTDGDISVHFTEADIVHTGDIWWNGVYPFIDYSTGGSIDGTIRGADAIIAMTTDKTIIVPGHGPIGTRAQLVEFRDILAAIRANVAALKAKGLPLEEIVKAKPTAAFDAKFGQFVIDPAFFTRIAYEGV